ncbi:MAG: universal stress protein [Bacteroidales bacterium]|nr:universal stress protein [Bacteroidales bacterium]
MASDAAKYSDDHSIKKILVPVDYSECSDFACRYAANIACKLGARIKFFHAYYTPSFDLIEFSGTVQIQNQLKEEVTVNFEKTEKETAEKFISAFKKQITSCDINSLDISYEVLPGLPADEIINYCGHYEPDLVIMGTHGQDKANTIMGSVTETIIRKLRYPVLAIPEKYSFAGEKNIKNLMYVTEFDESDFLSIKKLMNLTSQLEITIHCVHIGEEEGEWDRIKMDGLKDYFRNVYGKTEVVCNLVHSRNILADINDYVQEKKINIVSLTSRQRGILDKLFKADLTKKLFYHTNIPLLVFHS